MEATPKANGRPYPRAGRVTRRGHHAPAQHQKELTVTLVPKTSAPVNRSAAETEARQLKEAFLNALRAASARAKLFANVIDSVGVSLRHKQIDVDGAVAWLTQEVDIVEAEMAPKTGGKQ